MHKTPAPDPSPDDDANLCAAQERSDAVCLYSKIAANFLLAVGGVAAVGVLIVPSRTMGASRTARLEWQHRDAEITRALEAPKPAEEPRQP